MGIEREHHITYISGLDGRMPDLVSRGDIRPLPLAYITEHASPIPQNVAQPIDAFGGIAGFFLEAAHQLNIDDAHSALPHSGAKEGNLGLLDPGATDQLIALGVESQLSTH